MTMESIRRKEHDDYRMSKEDLLEANRRWKTLTEKDRLRYAPTVATGAILGGTLMAVPALEMASNMNNPGARKVVMASSLGLAGLGALLGAGYARGERKRYNAEEMMSPITAQKVEKLVPGARLSRGSMSFDDLDSIDRARAVLSNPEGRGAWALLGQSILGKRKVSPDVTSKTRTGPLKREAARLSKEGSRGL